MSYYSCDTCGKRDGQIVDNVETAIQPCNCGKAFFCGEKCFADPKFGHAGRVDSDHTVGLNVKRLVGHGHYDAILLEFVHNLDRYLEARWMYSDSTTNQKRDEEIYNYKRELELSIPEALAKEVSKKDQKIVETTARNLSKNLILMVDHREDPNVQSAIASAVNTLVKIWQSENRFTSSRKSIQESFSTFVARLSDMIISRQEQVDPIYSNALSKATNQSRETGRILNGKSK